MSTANAVLRRPTGVGSGDLILPSKPFVVFVSIGANGRGSVNALPRIITINGSLTTPINHEVLHAMKYYTTTTQFNCGIDLHARQMYVCLMDREGKKLVHTRSEERRVGKECRSRWRPYHSKE